MTSQVFPAKKVSASKSGAGIKTLIMASSLIATMGGWAMLAVGQIQGAVNTIPQSQPIVQPASPAVQNSVGSSNLQTSPRQVAVPNTQPQQQPRVLGRTRSSR
jgi:hypothetical protein